MEWFLFVEFDDNIVKFSFTNKYKFTRIYKEYTYNGNDICIIELEKLEKDLINTMNFNVAMKDSVYIICDIKSDVYDFIVKSMTKLLSRANAILDSNTFNITMQIK
jgi:hypothetical protein